MSTSTVNKGPREIKLLLNKRKEVEQAALKERYRKYHAAYNQEYYKKDQCKICKSKKFLERGKKHSTKDHLRSTIEKRKRRIP